MNYLLEYSNGNTISIENRNLSQKLFLLNFTKAWTFVLWIQPFTGILWKGHSENSAIEKFSCKASVALTTVKEITATRLITSGNTSKFIYKSN